MDINARLFNVSDVSSGLGQSCTSLCSWSLGLVLGFKDGSVLLVKAPDRLEINEWQVVRIVKHLSRAAMRCMQVGFVDGAERLIAITHEGVTLFSLPDLQLKAQAYKSAGASCCAWRGDRSADDADPHRAAGPDRQLLVYGKNRRLTLCAYSSRDLQFVNDMALSEQLVEAAWCGSYVCAVLRRALVFADPASKSVAPLHAWRAPAATQLLQLSPTQCLFQHDADLWYVTAGSGRAATPWTLPRVPAALALSHPFVLAAYADAIEVYAADEASMHPALQRISLEQLGMGAPGADGDALLLCSLSERAVAVVSGSTGHACLLQAEPLAAQVSAIAEGGLAQEALQLCQLEDFSEFRTLSDDLHIRYGVALFAQGEYEQGMLQVGSSSRSEPLAILQFFPALVPPTLQRLAPLSPEFRCAEGAEGPPPGTDVYRACIELLLPYLYSYRSRLLTEHDSAASPRASASPLASSSNSAAHLDSLASGKGGKSPTSRSLSSLGAASAARHGVNQQQRISPSTSGERADAEAADSGPSGRMEAGGPAANGVGAPLGAEDLRSKDASAAEGGGDEDRARSHDAAEARRSDGSERLAELQAVVDVALLNAWLLVGDRVALMRLVKAENHLPLIEGRLALSQAGLYIELVELYRQHAQHSDALELLYRLSREPEALSPPPDSAAASLVGLPGVWAALKYIHGLPAGSRSISLLICSHAERWLLAADPEACVEAILHQRGAVAPEDALVVIEHQAPHLAQSYLEAALDAGLAAPQQFHPKLAEMYLADLIGGDGPPAAPGERPALRERQEHVQPLPETASPSKADSPEQSEAAAKLLALLLSSPHLNPTDLQRGIPKNARGRGILRVRAIIHEQLSQHAEALAIYVNDLQDPSLAEEYADRLYAALKEQQSPSACAHMRPESGSLVNSNLINAISIPSIKHPEDVYTWLLREFVQHARQEHRRLVREGAAGGADARSVWAKPLVLLGRKWKSMDAVEALSMLPDELPAADLAPYLSSILKGMLKRSHEHMLHVGLLKSAMFDLKRQEVLARQRHVVITSVSVCTGCQRRVGRTQCVVTPACKLWHEGCFNSHMRAIGKPLAQWD